VEEPVIADARQALERRDYGLALDVLREAHDEARHELDQDRLRVICALATEISLHAVEPARSAATALVRRSQDSAAFVAAEPGAAVGWVTNTALRAAGLVIGLVAGLVVAGLANVGDPAPIVNLGAFVGVAITGGILDRLRR
jgi:hypothetical protein